MKFFRFLSLFLLFLSIPFLVGFKVPPFQGFVTDTAGVLSETQVTQLSAFSTELQTKTGMEVATLIVADSGEESIESVAQDVFDQWKIGQKGKDNGVLLVYAVKQKKMRIAVGYGLEGALPDGKAGRLRDEFILPLARSGHLAEAIENGHKAVILTLAKEAGVEISGDLQVSRKRHSTKSELPDWAQGILLILLILFLWKGRGWLLPFLLLGGFGGGRGGGFDDRGGGFGGFGGGSSGGGGASGDW